MSLRTLTTKIEIPAKTFVDSVAKKIKGHKRKGIDTLISFPPHLEFENVTISDQKLIMEKSMKPLDKFSRYRGVSGIIESDILDHGEATVLKTKIRLHTAAGEILKYFLIAGISLNAITWLILDFDWKILIGFLVAIGFVIVVPKMYNRAAIDDLEFYYHRMIEELTRK